MNQGEWLELAEEAKRGHIIDPPTSGPLQYKNIRKCLQYSLVH